MENNINIRVGGRYETSTFYFVEVLEIKDTVLVCNRLSMYGRVYDMERKKNGNFAPIKAIIQKDKIVREL